MGLRQLWPLALSGVLLVVYVFLSQNVTALVVGIGLGLVFIQFGPRIDTALGPLWPYRDRIPPGMRKVLTWVVPFVVAYLITSDARAFNLFSWLPFVGPDASVFAFTTLIAGLIAFVLAREPQANQARVGPGTQSSTGPTRIP